MLSFTPLTEENREEIRKNLLLSIPEADGEYLEEILDSFDLDGECEFAISSFSGCLLIRVFDMGYSFIYPVEISDGADALSAIEEIRAYSVREDIPLCFTDVPSEALGDLLPLFRHANIDAADSFGESYTVRIISEASAIDRLPEIFVDDEITLDTLGEEDDSKYATLCRDKETNKFWGYDDLADCDSADDSYFREVAESEFSRGIAISFAIRYKGSFAGEATVYQFDHKGSAQCAIRVLPEMRGRKIASRTLFALVNYGEKIGLVRICATVMPENEASVNLCKNHLPLTDQTEEGYLLFYKEFDN